MPTHSEALARLQARHTGAIADLAARLLEIGDDWQILPAQRHTAATAWRPDAPFVLIDGDLDVEGNLVVATGRHDQGALIVLGDVRCRHAITGHDQHLLVTGDLIATHAVVAELGNSSTHVGGTLRTDTLLSGRGAWLSLASAEGFQATHCSAYVMVGDTPLKPAVPASMADRLVDAVLDREEWDDMDPEDREQEDIDDLVMLDESAALRHLAAGGDLLRA